MFFPEDRKNQVPLLPASFDVPAVWRRGSVSLAIWMDRSSCTPDPLKLGREAIQPSRFLPDDLRLARHAWNTRAIAVKPGEATMYTNDGRLSTMRGGSPAFHMAYLEILNPGHRR